MTALEMYIRPFSTFDQEAVIALWRGCGLTRPWNNPAKDIERKLKVNPELFLVGIIDGGVVATAMAGYEGHRGWVNYLAVDPVYQRQGLGRQMMLKVEELLLGLGCPKINIQIRTDNAAAMAFYRALGFKKDEAVSMGKRLVEDG
jgi:ribosomal protein S18 acetylase RimI-like enzyme